MANDRSDVSGAIEVSAKTADEAIAKALQQLGISQEDADVEVLHAGSPGRLLGFGAEPARVRVTPRAGATRGTTIAGADAGVGVAEEEDEEQDSQRVRFGRARSAPRPMPTASVSPAAPPAPRAQRPREEGEAEEAPPTAGDAELARIMLAELLNRMGMGDAHTEVAAIDPITLNIIGDDLADLIGRRGENLRALQFILTLMVNKQLHRRVRVVVDVDGYRARREELLRSMAQRFAYRVRSTREPMQLEAMAPNERRIIHLTLAEDPDVMTESIGEGDARRVVIKPRG